jgi:hypothetical protein
MRHIIVHGVVIVSGGQWSRWQLVGWVAGLRLSRMSALVFGHPCLREVCRRLRRRHYRSVGAAARQEESQERERALGVDA